MFDEVNKKYILENIQGKIAVKRKQIEVEADSERKAEFQKQLQRLLIRKEIEDLKIRLDLLSIT